MLHKNLHNKLDVHLNSHLKLQLKAIKSTKYKEMFCGCWVSDFYLDSPLYSTLLHENSYMSLMFCIEPYRKLKKTTHYLKQYICEITQRQCCSWRCDGRWTCHFLLSTEPETWTLPSGSNTEASCGLQEAREPVNYGILMCVRNLKWQFIISLSRNSLFFFG